MTQCSSSALGDQAPWVSAWERSWAGCSVQAMLGALRPSGSSWFLAGVGVGNGGQILSAFHPLWPQQPSQPNPPWGSTFESCQPREAAPARLTSRVLLWPLCANSLDKPGNCRESHSVVSDSLQPHGLDSPLDSPDQNTGEGSLSLLQGIFPTQGSNPCCRRILYPLSHQGRQACAHPQCQAACCPGSGPCKQP